MVARGCADIMRDLGGGEEGGQRGASEGGAE
jgi:hypothetical protein